jgi:hypothetical protein
MKGWRDKVVMPVYNTAARSDEGAEALPRLARAFFYASPRTLMVLHWAVDSEAAVDIMCLSNFGFWPTFTIEALSIVALHVAV